MNVIVSILSDQVIPKAYQVLTLEANRMWLIQEQLMNYDWPKADKYTPEQVKQIAGA